MKNKNYSVKSNIFMILVSIAIILIIPSQIDGREIADSLGARFVPYLGCYIVLIPNVIQLLLKLIYRGKKKSAGAEAGAAAEKKSFAETVASVWKDYSSLVIVLALAFLAAFVVEKTGYILTYCLLCIGVLLVFKEKRWYFYVISCVLVVLVYIGFTKFLYVPLPTLF